MTTVSVVRPGKDKSPWSRWVSFLAPPALAYLLSVFFYTVVAWLSGEDFFTVESHHRWDSGHYRSIAIDGYEMFRCTDRWPDYPQPEAYCGNTGWFALFPMLMRIGSALGFEHELAGVFITEAALLGIMVALWYLLGAKLTSRNMLILALAAVFPGSIYLHALFPMAIGTLGLLLAIIGLKRGSWLIAGGGAAIAGASHLMGNAIIGVLILSVFFAWRGQPWLRRMWKAAAATGIGLLGFMWSSWIVWQATGRWDAYFEYQSATYGNGVNNPWESYENILNDGKLWFPLPHDSTTLELASMSSPRYTLIVNSIFMAVALVMTAIRAYRARGLDTVDWAALLLAGAIFLLPLIAGGMVTPYRNHVMLLPALILIRDAPRLVLAALFGLFAWVGALLGAAFYSKSLV